MSEDDHSDGTAEGAAAELLALIASGRPERLMDIALATIEGDEVRAAAKAELASLGTTLSTLALGEPAVAPSPDLRSRIVATMAARTASAARSAKARGAASRRAVLVIDMLNDHLTIGRALEVPRARDIVPALEARIEAARAERVPVVYVCDEHEADDSDLEAWASHNVRGSEGAQVWAPLAPKPGDHIVTKPTYSAFARSKLADVLNELRIDTLVLTGCLTQIGVFATATDALQRGYAVEIPADTQAGGSAETEQAAMTVLSILAPYGPARSELLAQLAG